MEKLFEHYCNEPAFPTPTNYAQGVDETMYCDNSGITRLEYCCMQMMKLPAFELDPEIAGAHRKLRMLQVLYYAEDMLRTIFEKGKEPDFLPSKHPAQ